MDKELFSLAVEDLSRKKNNAITDHSSSHCIPKLDAAQCNLEEKDGAGSNHQRKASSKSQDM
jgi:hypothetical protein